MSNLLGLAEKKQLIVAAIRPEALQKLTELESETKAIKSQPWEIENLEDVYSIATLAVIHKMTPLPMGLIQLIVEGLERVEIVKLVQTDPAYTVKFRKLTALTIKDAWAKGIDEQTIEALSQAIKSLWSEEAAMNSRFPEELLGILLNTRDPAQLAYQTSVLLQQDISTSQAILEEENLEQLLRHILAALQKEIEVHKLRGEILGETQKEIDQQQKEFFLRQQLKKIQEELGETDPERQEANELRSRLSRS